jgi:hypothetical protein
MSRPGRLALAAAALVLAAAPARAHAQRDTVPQPRPPAAPAPVRRDTIPVHRDTAQVGIPPEAVRGDTLPGAKQDTAPPDSTIAAPSFPAHPLPPANGFSDATWFFGPNELQYFQGLSLADLLDRIPGLVTTRSGGFGRPLGVSPFASGGGRFRIFLDGYELRPLNGATPDLQRIPLVNLQSLRIERGMDEIRVDLTSLRVADIRPFAQIEGMDGDLGTRALRGIFTRPVGRHVMAEVALDLDQSGGVLRQQPFSETHTVSRLSYAFTRDWGVQAEFRTTRLNAESRLSNDVELGSLDRSEAILRLRGRLGPMNLEAIGGRSLQRPAGADTLTERARSVQADFRLTVPTRIGMLAAGARLHHGQEGQWAPDQHELWGRLDFDPAPWLAATGEVRQLTLGSVTGVETSGSLRAGPWGGLSLFGQIATGNRGVPYLSTDSVVLSTIGGIGGTGLPTLDTVQVQVVKTLDTSVDGVRAGAEFNRGLFHLGAAVVRHDLDQAVPYGFAFDRTAPVQPGQQLTGVEGYASIPLLVRQLTLSGWYQRWTEAPDRPYLPQQVGRASLQFHGVYKQGNLEPTIRLEVMGRDQAVAYDPVQRQNVLIPRYAIYNFFVQVRIIDIRIFYRYDNLFNERNLYDTPLSRVPSGRALYGVRWFFRN